MEYRMETQMLEMFRDKLLEDERSEATINKYLRDVRSFLNFTGEGGAVSKDVAIAYKRHLAKRYAIASANSMLAAINHFFRAMGWNDCIVKAFKVQKEAFRASEKELSKEEYLRLLQAARSMGNYRLYFLMQTICATGIRVSELAFITVESLYARRARVSLKGKTRTVVIPKELCQELLEYAKEKNIKSGSVFVTRNGKPLDRSNILHEMKELCEEAEVEKEKVFPHNLRHLFAVTYYKVEKDLGHLADLLGHSNINTTRIYTLFSCEEQEAHINRLGLIV